MIAAATAVISSLSALNLRQVAADEFIIYFVECPLPNVAGYPNQQR
jgi:hypothetical protein